MTPRLLAIRLDSVGDMVLTGPAVRAMAATGTVDVLAGPAGAAAARLLPGVGEVLTWECPWIVGRPGAVDADDVAAVVAMLADRSYDAAVVFTSFHQSPLPTALLLRLAGVAWVGAYSEEYPGSLLDLRLPPPGDVPEAERALGLARAAGHELPDGDDGLLRLDVAADVGRSVLEGLIPAWEDYVVVHPGASVAARAWSPHRWVETVGALTDRGRRVVVTGSAGERALCDVVAAPGGVNLAGRTDLHELASVIAGATAVVVANTGPAHVAAAVGAPVVSLYAPTVPAARWAPYGTAVVLLGDQDAPCRGSRARECPVPGHPCLDGVTAYDVVQALARLDTTRLGPTPRTPMEVRP